MDDTHDDKVGYKRPPRRSQFQRGQSGNPKGRPRGSRSLITLIEQGMDRPVTVGKGDAKRKMSFRRAFVEKLLKDAYEGDPRARTEVLRISHVQQSKQDAEDQTGTVDTYGEITRFLSDDMLTYLAIGMTLYEVLRQNAARYREMEKATKPTGLLPVSYSTITRCP